MNKWKETTLADICESINYGYTASASAIPLGPKFLRITDIVSGHINWDNVPYCNIENDIKHKYCLNSGDIVIARTGASTGTSIYIENPPDSIFASYLVRLKIGSNVNPKYVSYFLKSKEFADYINGVLGDKSAQPNASARTMTQVKLSIPSLEYQEKVVEILGILDYKIELNHKMNEMLEAIAKAIFKSWFVDFDPVHAKMAGMKPSGMDNVTAALFPDSFQDSELGEIPKEWSVGTVEDNYSITMGQSPPGESYNEIGNGVLFHQGCTDFGWRFPSNKMYSTDPKRYARKHDTIISVRAPVGQLNMANDDICIGRGLAAARHISGCSSYTYYSMGTLKEEFENYEANGTVFGCIGKNDFNALKVIKPKEQVIKAFSDSVADLDQLIYNNYQQILTLTNVRDLLLSKLMSGKIELS